MRSGGDGTDSRFPRVEPPDIAPLDGGGAPPRRGWNHLAAPPTETPPDALAEFNASYLADLKAFNTKAFTFVGGIAAEDKVSAAWRRWVLHALAFISVVGGLLLAWAALANENPWVAGVVGVAALAVLGLIYGYNPLQTIERDIIYRRWSDTILASFYMQAGFYDTRLPEIQSAATLASEQFATLGLVHQTAARVTPETLAGLLSAVAGTEDKGSDEAATEITITTPADVQCEVGTAIESFEVATAGPEDLALEAAPVPDGIELEGRAFRGTPTAATDEPVVTTVTATSESLGKQTTATFSWTVTAPRAAADETGDDPASTDGRARSAGASGKPKD